MNMGPNITDAHKLDPNDIISNALNKSFHLKFNAMLCSQGTLIFVAEKNTEYTKYMSSHAPCLDDGDMVEGFDTELTCIFPHPINDYLRVGTLAESVNYPEMHFYIMSFNRGYDPEEIIKKLLKDNNGKYSINVEVIPITEEDSHGV